MSWPNKIHPPPPNHNVEKHVVQPFVEIWTFISQALAPRAQNKNVERCLVTTSEPFNILDRFSVFLILSTKRGLTALRLLSCVCAFLDDARCWQ